MNGPKTTFATRVAMVVTLVPTMTLAVVHSPWIASLPQFTEKLPIPDGVKAMIESLPFQANTVLAIVCLALVFVGAATRKKPAFWLAGSVAGPLAFAYSPFGLVRWAIQKRVPGDGLTIVHWAIAFAPVAMLLAIVLLERVRIDARTFIDRGIPARQVGMATARASTQAIVLLLLAGGLAAVITQVITNMDLGWIADGPMREMRVIAAAAAGVLAVVGILLLAPSGRAEPVQAGGSTRVVEATVDYHD